MRILLVYVYDRVQPLRLDGVVLTTWLLAGDPAYIKGWVSLISRARASTWGNYRPHVRLPVSEAPRLGTRPAPAPLFA